MEVIEALLSVAILFLLLGALVFLHELGHFLAAKAIGVQVSEFSVGFGKPLWRFTRGGTEFRLSMIPAGGYVRFADAEPINQYDDSGDTVLDRETPKRRIFVYAAGPAVNILVAVALFTLAAAGGSLQEDLEPVVGAVAVNIPQRSSFWDDLSYAFPAAEAGVQPGDRILTVNGRKVRSWADVRRRLYLKEDQSAVVQVERQGRTLEMEIQPPPGLRKRINASQVGLHPKSAFSNESDLTGSGMGGVEAETAAKEFAEAGVKDGSMLVEIDGDPIRSLNDARAALLKGAASKNVRMVFETDGRRHAVETDPARHLIVTIAAVDAEMNPALAGLEYGDRLEAVNGMPASDFAAVRASILENRSESEAQRMRFHLFPSMEERVKNWVVQNARKAFGKKSGGDSGCCAHVELHPKIADGTVQVKGLTLRSNFAQFDSELKLEGLLLTERQAPNAQYGFFGSIAKGAALTFESTGDALSTLKPLLSGEDISIATVNGRKLSTERIIESILSGGFNWMTLLFALYIMAWFSVDLAVVNLIPIPVLDGGRIFLDSIELARGRPLSKKLRRHILLLGAIILGVLFAFMMIRRALIACVIGAAVGFAVVKLKRVLKKALARRRKSEPSAA